MSSRLIYSSRLHQDKSLSLRITLWVTSCQLSAARELLPSSLLHCLDWFALQFARDGVLLAFSMILVLVSLNAIFGDYILSLFTSDGLDLLFGPDWGCAGRGSEIREWNLAGTGQSGMTFDHGSTCSSCQFLLLCCSTRTWVCSRFERCNTTRYRM